jgi:hypothetical protein
LVTLAMGAITLAACYRISGEGVAFLSLFQTILFIIYEIAVLTAVTYFFAVNAGAITTAVVTCCIFCLGHTGDTISKSLRGSEQTIWSIIRGVVPDLETFNMKSLASYGLSIGWREFGWASVYALCCVTFFLFLAVACFERKDILT